MNREIPGFYYGNSTSSPSQRCSIGSQSIADSPLQTLKRRNILRFKRTMPHLRDPTTPRNPSRGSARSKRSASDPAETRTPANTHQKQQKRIHLSQRLAKEKVRKPSFLHHPLVGADGETGVHIPSPAARRDQQARAYASQIRRKKLHQFEPWPNDYSIRHVLRNPRSGILIASEQFSPILLNTLLSSCL